MTEEDAFIQAIVASPDDSAPRLVFADWLEERGDPRGEDIRLDCQMGALSADDPRRGPIIRRKQALRRAHPAALAAWDRQFAVARIRTKLERLRRADPGFVVFGSETHRYRLNPCLTESELVAFEDRVGVNIPEEYRCFLGQVGNGGAGPDYGLFPLNLDRDVGRWPLDQPFPISTKRARTILARQRQGFYRPRVDYPFPGCLGLSEAGCGIVAFLVVTGEQRGTVWYGGDGLGPCADRNGQQLGMLGWYESWLDEWLAPGAIERRRKSFKRK